MRRAERTRSAGGGRQGRGRARRTRRAAAERGACAGARAAAAARGAPGRAGWWEPPGLPRAPDAGGEAARRGSPTPGGPGAPRRSAEGLALGEKPGFPRSSVPHPLCACGARSTGRDEYTSRTPGIRLGCTSTEKMKRLSFSGDVLFKGQIRLSACAHPQCSPSGGRCTSWAPDGGSNEGGSQGGRVSGAGGCQSWGWARLGKAKRLFLPVSPSEENPLGSQHGVTVHLECARCHI